MLSANSTKKMNDKRVLGVLRVAKENIQIGTTVPVEGTSLWHGDASSI
jgi:hypothetical protein